MRTIDLVVDLLIDHGCNTYTSAVRLSDPTIYPRVTTWGNEIYVYVNRDEIWDIVINDDIILARSRHYEGEFNANPVYRFELADPNSIPELELFIKNMLNKNTSSPA